jgi:hypothetical protein
MPRSVTGREEHREIPPPFILPLPYSISRGPVQQTGQCGHPSGLRTSLPPLGYNFSAAWASGLHPHTKSGAGTLILQHNNSWNFTLGIRSGITPKPASGDVPAPPTSKNAPAAIHHGASPLEPPALSPTGEQGSSPSGPQGHRYSYMTPQQPETPLKTTLTPAMGSGCGNRSPTPWESLAHTRRFCRWYGRMCHRWIIPTLPQRLNQWSRMAHLLQAE